MSTLQCDIVTPERKFYSDEVEFVVLPGAEGEMGIYEKHEPIVTILKSGSVRLTFAGKAEQERFAVMGGYAQCDGERVVILADRACKVSELDAEELERQLDREQAKLDEFDGEDAAKAFLASEVEWLKLQLAQL